MDQRKQELAYYKTLKESQEGEIRVLRAVNEQLERIIKDLENVPDEEAKKEPRFLLDKDSPCYGCPEYKNINECDSLDPWEHWGEGDKNGGVCDTEKPCFSGSGNTYKGGKDMLARKCDRCGKRYGIDETVKIGKEKLEANGMDVIRNVKSEDAYHVKRFDLCPDCMRELVGWLERKGFNEDL